MNFDNIPIEVIEEVEMKTGFLIEDLFEDTNKSPYRKRAMAYLAAKSRNEEVSWDELGKKTVSELWAIMAVDSDEDPKEVSEESK
jgi:hypothetical protein